MQYKSIQDQQAIASAHIGLGAASADGIKASVPDDVSCIT